MLVPDVIAFARDLRRADGDPPVDEGPMSLRSPPSCAGMLDGVDGRVARLIKGHRKLGAGLDSLS